MIVDDEGDHRDRFLKQRYAETFGSLVIVVLDCLDDILLILFIFSDALEQRGQKIKTYYGYTLIYAC